MIRVQILNRIASLQIKIIHRENQVHDNTDPEAASFAFIIQDIKEEIAFLNGLLDQVEQNQ